MPAGNRAGGETIGIVESGSGQQSLFILQKTQMFT